MLKLLNSKFKLIFTAVTVLVILITGGIIIYQSGISAVDPKNEETVTVNIPSGSGASSIVYILDDAGLVKNTTCAKIQARIGRYDSLQANTYVFSKSMSLSEIFTAINEGDFNYISKEEIQIIAGDTIPEIAEAMSQQIPFAKDEILAVWSDEKYLKTLIDKYWFITDEILDAAVLYPLEGYLYADSYFILESDPSIESMTEMALDKMDEKLSERKDEIKAMGFTIHEFLTMTSIVTAEGGDLETDLPVVAGVFMNRLDKGMELGSDVTVNYVHHQKVVNITQSQLDVDSEYNTRKYAGLPAGPICSVLDTRMDAVINYEDTDYLFFYGCPDGTVLFAETLEQHNKNAEENPWPEDK